MQNPQRQAVEDDALDVIRKAMAGLTADGWVFQKKLHRLVNTLSHSLLAGDMNPSDWDEVATHLQLHAPSLLALASDPTVPSIPLPFDWQVWNLPFGPYSVNAYLIPVSAHQCILFDAGFEPTDLINRLAATPYTPVAVCITHNHRDHVGALQALVRRHPEIKIHAMDATICHGTEPLRHDTQFEICGVKIRAIQTPGHAWDGVSFEINQDRTCAIIGGDTIYARSCGKIPEHYRSSLEILSQRILCKPGDTLLLPGHGPISSIGDEYTMNPFFAQSTG